MKSSEKVKAYIEAKRAKLKKQDELLEAYKRGEAKLNLSDKMKLFFMKRRLKEKLIVNEAEYRIHSTFYLYLGESKYLPYLTRDLKALGYIEIHINVSSYIDGYGSYRGNFCELRAKIPKTEAEAVLFGYGK